MRSIDLILSGRKPRSGVQINEGIGARSDHPEVEVTRTTISGCAAAAYRNVDQVVAKMRVKHYSLPRICWRVVTISVPCRSF